jgi:hypothetical protein
MMSSRGARALDSERRQIGDAAFNAIASADERLRHGEIVQAWLDSTNAPSGPDPGTVQLFPPGPTQHGVKFDRAHVRRCRMGILLGPCIVPNLRARVEACIVSVKRG